MEGGWGKARFGSCNKPVLTAAVAHSDGRMVIGPLPLRPLVSPSHAHRIQRRQCPGTVGRPRIFTAVSFYNRVGLKYFEIVFLVRLKLISSSVNSLLYHMCFSLAFLVELLHLDIFCCFRYLCHPF